MSQLDLLPYLEGQRWQKQSYLANLRAIAELYRSRLTKLSRILDENTHTHTRTRTTDDDDDYISFPMTTDLVSQINQVVSVKIADLRETYIGRIEGTEIIDPPSLSSLFPVYDSYGNAILSTVGAVQNAFHKVTASCIANAALFTTMANTASDKIISLQDYLNNVATLTKDSFFTESNYYASIIKGGVTPRQMINVIGESAKAVKNYTDLSFNVDDFNDSNIIWAALVEVGQVITNILVSLIVIFKKIWDGVTNLWMYVKDGITALAKLFFNKLTQDFETTEYVSGIMDVPFASFHCSSIMNFSMMLSELLEGGYSCNNVIGNWRAGQNIISGYFDNFIRNKLVDDGVIELSGSGLTCRVFADEEFPTLASGVYIYFHLNSEVSSNMPINLGNSLIYKFNTYVIESDSTNEGIYNWVKSILSYVKDEITICPWHIGAPDQVAETKMLNGFDWASADHWFFDGTLYNGTTRSGSADYANSLKLVNYDLDNLLSSLKDRNLVTSDQSSVFQSIRCLLTWLSVQFMYMYGVDVSSFYYEASVDSTITYNPAMMVHDWYDYIFDDIFLPYNTDSTAPVYIHVQTNEERAKEVSNVIMGILISAVLIYATFKINKARKAWQHKLEIQDHIKWNAYDELANNTDPTQHKALSKAAWAASRKLKRMSRLASLFGIASVAAVDSLNDIDMLSMLRDDVYNATELSANHDDDELLTKVQDVVSRLG